MKKLLLILGLLTGLTGVSHAQDIRYVRKVASLPATCTTSISMPVSYNGALYQCVAGTYTALSAGTSGASTALDNLSAVSINTALLAQTGVDLGSTTKPFRDLYLFGSGTYATTYIKQTGTPTSTRTITWPDATGIPVISAAALTPTRVPFGVAVNSGVGLTDSAGFTSDASGNITVASCTGCATAVNALTDTWTNSGTTYTAIQMNVTNTASASASKLLDLQIGGTTVFAINKSGAFQTTGPFSLQVPDATATGGNTRGTNSVDLQIHRTAAANVASGNESVTLGYDNKASANQSYAFGYNNQATSTSTIAIGQGNVASGSQAQAYGINGIADGGSGLVFSTYYATNGGATRGIAMGQLSTNRGIADTLVYSSGRFGGSGYGDGQIGWYVLRRITTDNTAGVVLTTDAATPSTTNEPVLPNNSVYVYTCDIVARRTDSADYGAWTITGAIRRDANAAATAILGTPTVTAVIAPSGAWTAPAATANTTRGSLEITVAGAAAETIRWVAQCRTTEVTN